MKLLFILFAIILHRPVDCIKPASDPIGKFIQINLVGLPEIHSKETWIFDPDIAVRRRKQFIELHGDKAEKLIERLGLGIDGFEDDRLRKQRERDEGHLGGLNALLP